VWLPRREAEWRRTGIAPRVACWDLRHVARFLESIRTDRYFSLWWLIALRGLRRGEAAGLDLQFNALLPSKAEHLAHEWGH